VSKVDLLDRHRDFLKKGVHSLESEQACFLGIKSLLNSGFCMCSEFKLEKVTFPASELSI
jgi:hypothetical protein